MPSYLVNDAGDIWAEQLDDGRRVEVDPAAWGWHGPQTDDLPEWRRTAGTLQELPGFAVEVTVGKQFVPGPRPTRAGTWLGWSNNAAPPAAIMSKGGVDGTRAYFDRLSDALGRVARLLPGRPERSPFIVHDFVAGQHITITYTAPPLGPGDSGTVYLVTDGDGIKIGYTEATVEQRIAALQTGNPRTISPIATIHGVNHDVEAALHASFGEHQGVGEWFRREPVLADAELAGGWEHLIRKHLGPGGDWQVHLHASGESS